MGLLLYCSYDFYLFIGNHLFFYFYLFNAVIIDNIYFFLITFFSSLIT